MTVPVSIRKDRWFAGFMVVVSALLLAQAYRYPAESAQFPRFLMILQLIFSVLLLAQAFRPPPAARADALTPKESGDTLSSLYAPVKVFVAASLYIVAIDYLGYYLATAIFLCAAMFWFGSRRPLMVVSVTAGFLLIVYALFASFMGVRLPEGALF